MHVYNTVRKNEQILMNKRSLCFAHGRIKRFKRELARKKKQKRNLINKETRAN